MKRTYLATCSALAGLAMISGCGHSAVVKRVAVVVPTTRPVTPSRPPVVRKIIWPLTGLAASRAPTEPALSVKIDNAPAARPQSGLDRADLVFECLVEGGMSRFLAVYQSHSVAELGPIRSARPVDGALLNALNGGIFAYSGAATGEIAPARAYSASFLLSNDDDPVPFYRLGSRSAPENVYSSSANLREEAARKSAHPGLPRPLFTYGPVVAGSPTSRQLSVVVGGSASASWVYAGGSWLRSENGSPHLLANGQQIRATNVVVLRVQVTHSGIIDAAGNEDPFVLAWGSGAAEVFRNGVVEHGRWSRPSIANAYRFTSAAGGPLTLAAGPTWIELIPANGSVSPG